jgi:hypothetical protein
VTRVGKGSAGSVAPVIRRLTMLAAAGLAATGCATFTDNDVVARVGDAELSSDELSERLNGTADTTPEQDDAAAVDADAAERVPGDVARESVGAWIREQLVASSDLAAQYSASPSALGIACIDVAIAADEAEASAIKQRLDGGEEWDDVVAPIEAAYGYESQQPCVALVEYEQRFGVELAQAFGALTPADGPQVVDAGESGFTVMRAQPIGDIPVDQLVTALGSLSADGEPPPALVDLIAGGRDADVYVDPRLGTFDHDRWLIEPVN